MITRKWNVILEFFRKRGLDFSRLAYNIREILRDVSKNYYFQIILKYTFDTPTSSSSTLVSLATRLYGITFKSKNARYDCEDVSIEKVLR